MVELARYLSSEHEVHVFSIAARTDRHLAPECRFHAVPVAALGDGVRFSARELASFARNAASAVAAHEHDLVYTCAPSTWVADVLCVPGVARDEAALAGISTWRYAAIGVRRPGDLVRRLLERRALGWRGLRRLHAHAPSVRDALVCRYGFSPDDILVVPPGVDVERFRPPRDKARARAEAGIPDERSFVVLFCGSDFHRKGLDRAIRALACLPPSLDALLLVLGGGPEAPYRKLASELSVSDRIRFLGLREDAWRFYQAADAVVLPTRADVWGVIPFEAMASGVPAVVSAAAGSSQAVEHGKTGIVLPEPFRVEALTEALVALATHIDLRRSIARSGLRAVHAHSLEHRLKTIAEDLLAVAEARREHTPIARRARRKVRALKTSS